MPPIISYDEALKAVGKAECSLLLGNGFSIKYFNYKNLLEKADIPDQDPLRLLFSKLETVDFERTVKALEDAAIVEDAYGNHQRSKQLIEDADRLRTALVHAVRATHPAHREDIQDTIPSCLEFLKPFFKVFTMNYDLLLYWVILSEPRFSDGFGLGVEQNNFRGPFKPNAHCNLFNVHGGLHLFSRPDGEIEKRLMGQTGVIDMIAEAITAQKRLPLYVAEGTSVAKLSRINSIPYLKHCYETLMASTGPFFVYGHSADPNDDHIYNALFQSKIDHLYFFVHQPSTQVEKLDGELARHQKRNKSKVNYTFVDSESARVWDRK
jgi:hypothetical protein